MKKVVLFGLLVISASVQSAPHEMIVDAYFMNPDFIAECVWRENSAVRYPTVMSVKKTDFGEQSKVLAISELSPGKHVGNVLCKDKHGDYSTTQDLAIFVK